MSERRVAMGRVAGVFGVRGWLKIHSFSRPVEGLLKYRRWTLVSSSGEFVAELLDGRVHGHALVAQISGADGEPISDRDVAAKLVGAQIEVQRTALPKLPKGQFYWIDLIGLNVINEQDEALGEVADVTSNGAQDVLVLRQGEVERLIPFINGPIVKSVDLKAKRIVCDWQLDY